MKEITKPKVKSNLNERARMKEIKRHLAVAAKSSDKVDEWYSETMTAIHKLNGVIQALEFEMCRDKLPKTMSDWEK